MRLLEKVLGLAVLVLFGLLLVAAIALLAAQEVVILTAAAHPAPIREVKLGFRPSLCWLVLDDLHLGNLRGGSVLLTALGLGQRRSIRQSLKF